MSLLSPDGTWYAAASLAATGSDKTVGWLGDTVAVFRTTEPGFTLSDGDVSLVNLRTGASRGILSGVTTPEWIDVTSNGTLVAKIGYEESFGFFSYDSDMTEHSVCGGLDLSVAPDGARVVCTDLVRDPGTGDQTEILVVTLGSGAPAEVIDTFRLDPGWYVLRGWLDADTFLVSRQDPVYGQAAATYYTYNNVTRTVADFALPYPASPSAATDWVDYDRTTQTYADRRDDGLHLFAGDGAPILVVPCAGGAGAAYSGTRVIVTCSVYEGTPSHTTLTLVNLESGTATQVADVQIGSEHSVQAVYPYTGNVD